MYIRKFVYESIRIYIQLINYKKIILQSVINYMDLGTSFNW